MEHPGTKCGGLLKLALCLTLFAFLLSGCGSDPDLPGLPHEAVVLAFGDSLTFGTGAKADESYPAVLQDLIDRRVINAGIPGEVSAEGRRRLPVLLERHEPELLLLCHGGNDLLRKRDRERLKANLHAMIGMARERGIPVVLIGVPRPALLLLESDETYPAVAEKLGVPLESELLPEILGDTSLKSDPIHPNAAGYRQLAEGIAELLRDRGAI